MLELLWLVPAIPFASAAILAVLGPRLGRTPVWVLGAGSIGASTVISILIAASFLSAPPPGHAFSQTLWVWISAGGFTADVGLYLDALSLIMMLVVSFVGFLIHLYSAEYLENDDGYSRFFAYMNLFVGSMLTLVLGNNLLLLFLGWEGVGLCSYLLIGFWYRDPVNGRAAQKAFIVTRVGDTAMTIGLLLLFTHLGTLQIQELMKRAQAEWPVGSELAIVAAAMLLGGAVGKSAQLPLQTWLPDAMAGPTPTSALIHAATMVTAGVYLIARTHVLFSLAPSVMLAVAIVGAATLLMAGFSALTQDDIKRTLAYSTVSQIGYMFLALGVGAWSAALFHFMTHAFFKALLFLAAGIVIEALHHEQNMFRMGGLRQSLPIAYWCFLIGGAALAGLPLVTSGFYSKDLILWETWSSPAGSPALWIAGMIGVLMTSLYTFRLIFLVFYGEEKTHVHKRPRWQMTVPVIVLCVCSIAGGFVNIPPSLGDVRVFDNFMHTALPATAERHAEAGQGFGLTETMSELTAAGLFIIGFLGAWFLYFRRREVPERLAASGAGRALHRWWYTDWGMDWLYETLFVRPFVWVADFDRNDFVDAIYNGLAAIAGFFWRLFSFTETGRLRWYAAGIVFGSVLFVAIVLFS